MRYKELKYNGKIYNKNYEIDEILIQNNMNWLIDTELENIRIEITKNTLVINAGIWYNGVFEYGVIRDIDFRNGTIENGVIYNGGFKNIDMENGLIFNGTFLNGIIHADIRGGVFLNVNLNNCKIEKDVKIKKN
jgi:uncharacterized protein YjbI with pentapeptide repeats